MTIRDVSELEEIDIENLEFLGFGHYGNVYKLDNSHVLKIFHDEKLALILEKNHAESFIEYLTKLSNKKLNIIVAPEAVYKDEHGYVLAYVSKYINGIKLNSDGFGEIDINVFMKALESFYCELSKIKDLIFYDGSARNLILEDGLKLVDLDLAKFQRCLDYEDVLKENYRILNNAIYKAITKLKSEDRLIDINLFELVCLIESGSYSLPNLLTEYINYINNRYFEVKKVKDLRYPYVGRI